MNPQPEPASDGATRFRKKPVVIEAFPFTVPMSGRLPGWLADAMRDGNVKFHPTRIQGDAAPYLIIKTLEGDHRADLGDWIIRGVKGELYPCKPDIFAATYEPVAPPPPEPVADAGGVVEVIDLLTSAADSIRSLLAQVESLKAERDDLQAEAGTQALTIRRLTQELEAARIPFVPWLWADPAFDPIGEKPTYAVARLKPPRDTAQPWTQGGSQYALVLRWDLITVLGQLQFRTAQSESRKRSLEAAESALATEREAKARMVEAAQALADDYQTSPRHHPDHVLVPLAAFEALRAALQATAGQGGEHGR